MLSDREVAVLLRIGRSSSQYRSAILGAVDIPAAESLRDRGLAHSCTFPDWWNLTEKGVREAQGYAS